MKSGLNVFLKSVLTVCIECIFITLLLISFIFLGDFIHKKSEPLAKWVLIFYFILSFFYLFFSNTTFKSVSAILLRYVVKTDNKKIPRICLSNIIFYGLLYGYAVMTAWHIVTVYYYLIQVLLVMEFITCFIPKFDTRFSLYLLRITWEKTPGKKLPNDGILL